MTPPKALPSCSLEARITRVDRICREHVVVTAEVADLPASSPGQFLQLQCREDLTTDPQVRDWRPGDWPRVSFGGEERPVMLRRPFSIADREEVDGRSRVSVISRAIGPGTRWLDGLRAGETLNLTGPLGRGFTIPAADRTALLIGGGVGIPPLLYLARDLAARGHTDARVLFGVQSVDLLPVRRIAAPAADGIANECLTLPGDATYPSVIATDDGSLGMRGRVTDALRALHAREGATWRRPIVFACGPEPMLRAVAAVTRDLSLDCEICLERYMGCGLGTCLSCVVRVHDDSRPEGWRWALSCQEGPVFERDRVLAYDPS